MGWELVTRRFSKALADFIESSADRWSDAANKIASGSYPASEMRTDVGDSIVQGLGVWATLLAPSPSPVVPVATVRVVAGDLLTSTASALAVVEQAIPLGAMIEVSELLLEGDPSKSLQANVGSQGALNDEILVTVLQTGPPAPDTGIYHGVVLVNGTVVAAVVINVVVEVP